MSRLVGTLGDVGKKVSRTVANDGASVTAYIKWSPYADTDGADVEVSSATVEQAAASLIFLANASAENGIDYTSSTLAGSITYADTNANTVQKLIDIVNGVGVGQTAFTRLRAGYGDCRPGTSLDANSGNVVAATNVLLGLHDIGLGVTCDGANTPTVAHRVALGTGGAKSGGGSVFADHFESDYSSTTAGVRSSVRAQGRRREEQPGLAQYQVYVTDVQYEAAFASNAKVIDIYDVEDNLVASFPIGSGTTVSSISEDNPVVLPVGSPAFVEGSGTGVLTDGSLSVTGFIRIA